MKPYNKWLARTLRVPHPKSYHKEVIMENAESCWTVKKTFHAIKDRMKRADSFGDNWLFGRDDDISEEAYIHFLKNAWLLLIDMIERLGHGEIYKQVQNDYEKVLKNPSDSKMGVEEPYLVHSARMYDYLNMIEDMYLKSPFTEGKSRNTQDIDTLVSLIRNSEYLISQRRAYGFVPCDESDVHDRVEGLIKSVFPDAKTKPTLTKPIKNFVPDTGVDKIKTVIEYKYLKNANDGKNIVDELLADTQGYANNIYDTFIFVIYETERVFPESDWNAAVLSCNPRNKIETIVLRGTLPTENDIKVKENIKEMIKYNNKSSN